MKITRDALSTSWERRTARVAIAIAALALAVAAAVLAAFASVDRIPWGALVLAPVAALVAHRLATGPLRRRRRILSTPFPAEFEAVLQREVAFFRALDEADRSRFRRELQVFLGEKRITGIGHELSTATRVLAGASAIIPIFGFPEWEWEQIREVLIYPDRFDGEFAFAGTDGRHTLGMVGTGALERLMILSEPDLLAGFRTAGDKRNVGLHEFAHLVDKSDGAIDGVPGVGLDRGGTRAWLDLVRRKMAEMRRGESDIDAYGLTNEAEFFAVSAEYFFERPGVMQRKHPELYAMLARVFEQDPAERAGAMLRRPQRFGRNSPCPCGSGEKFKRCCLERGA